MRTAARAACARRQQVSPSISSSSRASCSARSAAALEAPRRREPRPRGCHRVASISTTSYSAADYAFAAGAMSTEISEGPVNGSRGDEPSGADRSLGKTVVHSRVGLADPRRRKQPCSSDTTISTRRFCWRPRGLVARDRPRLSVAQGCNALGFETALNQGLAHRVRRVAPIDVDWRCRCRRRRCALRCGPNAPDSHA